MLFRIFRHPCLSCRRSGASRAAGGFLTRGAAGMNRSGNDSTSRQDEPSGMDKKNPVLFYWLTGGAAAIIAAVIAVNLTSSHSNTSSQNTAQQNSAQQNSAGSGSAVP